MTNDKQIIDEFSPIAKLIFTLEKTGKNYDLEKIKKKP